jgi:hypothetical protein
MGHVGSIGLAGKGSAVDGGDQPWALRHTTGRHGNAGPEPVQSVCREGTDVIKVIEFVVLGAVLAELRDSGE